MPSGESYEIIIVGAGHSGLSTSYYLQQQGISHIILERGEIGHSWRTQRWDNFCLNTPNWMNRLPGDSGPIIPQDGFMHRDAFADYLTSYAHKCNLPVQNRTKVVSARENNGRFEVTADREGITTVLHSRQLVIASGIMSAPKIPALSNRLPAEIHQLHAADYRNAGELPAGAVLVAGGGQSGVQIAEDLLKQKRKVYLATSRVGRYPRRYRGRDILEWATENKFFDAPVESITDPAMLKMPNPHISGTGRYGHTLSLQSLACMGASLLGRLKAVNGYDLEFEDNAADNIRFADEFSAWFKKMIDTYIAEKGIICEPPETDPDDLPATLSGFPESMVNLNLGEQNISTVIWATGYTADFNWISPCITNENKVPVHQHGISPVKGLYFIGFPWLRTRKSGIIYGMEDDASFIVDQMLRFIKGPKIGG